MSKESAENSFSPIIVDHIAKCRSRNTHPAKLIVLSDLLEKLFGVKLEELLPGIETKLGSKLLGLRGSVDLLFSNVVFEIKVDLKRELEDAEKQLLKYFQALLEREPEKKHIGIVTDGIGFIAYLPRIKSGVIVGLSKASSLNMAETSPSESVLWLDSFVFAKPKIIPSAMDLRWRFGPDSPTYSVSVDTLNELWDKVWDERDVILKSDLWARNMEIVYGSRPQVASFIDHTYLVTLVKVIVYLRLSGGNIIAKEDLKKALTGEYFASYGIANLIEEDFFAWTLHPKIADDFLELVHGIAKELSRYDLSQINEDFFKAIYQEIVKRSERHRLGEYYTPEWLVELILNEALRLFYSENHRVPRILDPACGSGTFLCNAIRIVSNGMLKRGESPSEILDSILENVVGVDINPLAVVIAKANYVIALGELLRVGRRKIVPIYVADSIKPPEVTRTIFGRGKIRVYEHSIEAQDLKGKPKNYKIQVPESVVVNKVVFSQILDSFKASINSYYMRKNRKEAFELFERNCVPSLSEDEILVMNDTLSTILKLIDDGNDAIWVFMLSNIYAPVILSKSKFDIVSGNPPWIAMRYIENKNYQNFLKDEILSYNLLESDQVHLFTHMEMATLFFCKTVDLYLNNKGLITFVMPRSILTGALHHIKFREFKKPRVRLAKIFDLEEVSPLFNVPSCVIFATKGEKTSYPVTALKYSGVLEEKDLKYSNAIKQLKVNEYSYESPSVLIKRSWYHDRMREGATLVPRSLWFIDFEVHETLGVDFSRPLVKTSKDAISDSKEPWRGIELKGNVNADFMYATLLGGDIVSFGFSKMRPVVLPIEPTPTGYRLIDIKALRNNGFEHMANWLEMAQKLWEERRTEKSTSRFPRILDRLDYNGLLSSQNPQKKYVILYNSSGTNVVSCVINREELRMFSKDLAVKPKGFVSDAKTWFYETNNDKEAYYLCGVLNSDVVNVAIKPLQTRGLWGERDIHRRPLMIPIPKFEEKNAQHLEIAAVSQTCHKILGNKDFENKSTAAARSEARTIIAREIERIDELVSELLKLK
jgi:SAM-dependent methyltransferase